MHNKDKFLEIFASKAGNISEACKAANITRRTYYDWMQDDEEFKQSVNEIQEGLLDLAESKLLENIKAGKEQSIFFYLKTIAKKRGYVERQEITGSEGKKLFDIRIIDGDND
jgi:hypothetical protein